MTPRTANTVRELLLDASRALEASGVDSARLNSELLLGHVLNSPRLHLLLNAQLIPTNAQILEFQRLIELRALRHPLQHLTGTAAFLGCDVAVNRQVLVPRPETETLALRALNLMEGRGAVTLMDLGTGSGCLSIALALALPQAMVHALDISAAALAMAQKNAESNGVDHRIHFHHGNCFQALRAVAAATSDPSRGQANTSPGLGGFDLIVSNPPYIPSAEIEHLQPEVRDHDPRNALDGGHDGLDFYRILAAEGAVWLKPTGFLVAEFGDDQGASIQQLFQPNRGWSISRLEKDLSGRDRVIIVGTATRANL